MNNNKLYRKLIGNYFKGSQYEEIKILNGDAVCEDLYDIFRENNVNVEFVDNLEEFEKHQKNNQILVTSEDLDGNVNYVKFDYILSRCRICNECLMCRESDVEEDIEDLFEKLTNSGVIVYKYRFPILSDIIHRTEDEEWFYRNGTDTLRFRDILNDQERYLNVFPKYSDITEIQKIFRKIPVIKKGNTYVSSDYRSEKVNIINGYRCTTDCPDISTNKIWLFGKSQVFGRGVEDADTIASILQRMVNEAMHDRYQVINAGISAVADTNIISQLQDTLFHSGDIVIYMYLPRRCYNDEKCRSLEYYNLANDINSKDNRQTAFMDSIPHTNYIGNEIIAQALFERIKNDSKLSVDNKCEVRLGSTTAEYGMEIDEFFERIAPYIIKDTANKTIGSIVMNCNPFTCGHRYLIETAAGQVDYLYVFVVEEDKSIFPFKDRFELVKNGTKDLTNVIVLPSGKFMISSTTFPEYFLKETNKSVVVDSSIDLNLFGRYIAERLHITVRFAGEEPIDPVTRQYNMNMRDILPGYGVKFVEIPRLQSGNQVISATRVRQYMKDKQLEKVKTLVPDTTYQYLQKLSDEKQHI